MNNFKIKVFGIKEKKSKKDFFTFCGDKRFFPKEKYIVFIGKEK